MYQVTSAHAIPEKPVRREFPFKALEVGQSFDVPAPHGNGTLAVRSARVSACNCAKNSGKKFTSKLLGNVVRFWRVS